jgi:hypothetical protein
VEAKTTQATWFFQRGQKCKKREISRFPAVCQYSILPVGWEYERAGVSNPEQHGSATVDGDESVLSVRESEDASDLGGDYLRYRYTSSEHLCAFFDASVDI